MLHAMLADQTGQHSDSLLLLAVVEGRIHHGCIQHLAGSIHHGNLAAVAVSGVQTHGDKAFDRRLHQQRFQIQCKIMDSTAVCTIRKITANFTLDRGENQSLIRILSGSPHEYRHMIGRLHCRTANQSRTLISNHSHIGFQNTLFFTTVDSQNLVIQQPANGLGEIIVQAVNAVGIRIFRLAGQHTAAIYQLPKVFSDVRIVRQIFCDNIRGALKGFFNGIDTLFRVNVGFCQYRRILSILGKDCSSQAFQSLFTGHSTTGTAFLLIGAVQILHFRQSGCGIDGSRQFFRHLSLIFNGFFHLVPSLL